MPAHASLGLATLVELQLLMGVVSEASTPHTTEIRQRLRKHFELKQQKSSNISKVQQHFSNRHTFSKKRGGGGEMQDVGQGSCLTSLS